LMVGSSVVWEGSTILGAGSSNFFCISFTWGRVDWPVTEHLSAEGRSDPRGGLCCFWCPNKTWTPPHGTSNTLTIIKNRLEI
jgi:hypothetical protein